MNLSIMSIHNFANRQLRQKEECFFFNDSKTSNTFFIIGFCALCCRNRINEANLKRRRDPVMRSGAHGFICSRNDFHYSWIGIFGGFNEEFATFASAAVLLD